MAGQVRVYVVMVSVHPQGFWRPLGQPWHDVGARRKGMRKGPAGRYKKGRWHRAPAFRFIIYSTQPLTQVNPQFLPHYKHLKLSSEPDKYTQQGEQLRQGTMRTPHVVPRSGKKHTNQAMNLRPLLW